MSIRSTRHITKNSDIVNRPLPSDLLVGEPIINTAEGILYYSGVTTSTDEWTPAGTGVTANFFEVGSNLYDLRLRNKLTKYQGVSGAGLIGKFLSGTTSGFVLADISSIVSVDSYTTGGTYNSSTNIITLNLNNSKPSVSITGITDTYVTGVTFTNSLLTLRRNEGQSNLSVNLGTFTGLTASNLTSGRVVYVGTGGLLTDESGFEYNAATNTLTAGNINTAANGTGFVGTGGLIVGSGGTITSYIKGNGDSYFNNVSATTIFVTNETWTIELVDSQSVDFYAPYQMQINSISNVLNTPTIALFDDDVAYTLTNTITIGSKITVSASTASVIILNVSK